MDLILFILTTWGLSNILANMVIAKPLRQIKLLDLGKMIKCTACNSFWIGILLENVYHIQSVDNIYLALLLSGLLASGTSWILFSILQATNVYDKY